MRQNLEKVLIFESSKKGTETQNRRCRPLELFSESRPMENLTAEASDVLSRIVHQVTFETNQIDMSGMLLTEDDIQVQLSRRRPGQSALTTAVLFPLHIY